MSFCACGHSKQYHESYGDEGLTGCSVCPFSRPCLQYSPDLMPVLGFPAQPADEFWARAQRIVQDCEHAEIDVKDDKGADIKLRVFACPACIALALEQFLGWRG